MTLVSIALALFLFLLCVSICLARARRRECLALLDWAILGIGLVYGAGWLSVLDATLNGENGVWAGYILPYRRYYLMHNLSAVVLLGAVFVGWRIGGRAAHAAGGLTSRWIPETAGQLHVYAWLILLIAFALRWLYVLDYGGFISYLEYAASVRSSMSVVDNRFSFLQPFSGMAIASSFLFFACLVDGPRSKGPVVGFLLSLAFAIYVLYSLLGRMGFLVFVATFLVALLYVQRVRPIRMLLIALGGAAAALVVAYVLSNALQLKGADTLPSYVARELSFPFISFFAQLESGDHLYRWFRDFAVSPLYLLPSSWWGSWIDDISQINTLVVMGAKKGDLGETTGIPVDLLTLGVMQASFLGVPLVGMMFGGLIRVFQGMVDGLGSRGLRAIILAFVAIRVAVYAVAYAHPLHLISGLFGIAASIGVIVACTFLGRLRIGIRG